MQWKNASITILILLLTVNASFIYMASGDPSITDTIGVEVNLDQGPFGESNREARSIEAVPSGSIGFALGNAALMLTNTLNTIWNLLFAFPKVLLQLNIPLPIVTLLASPLYVLVAITIVHMITGRG